MRKRFPNEVPKKKRKKEKKKGKEKASNSKEDEDQQFLLEYVHILLYCCSYMNFSS